jgi:signal transduction histidine kinase
VRLESLFPELKADYQAQADEKKITMLFELPPKLPVIQADRDKFVLALHNLIGNALKYTMPGGKVTVAVRHEGKQLVVDVSDTGIGIDPKEADKIFERFYRASPAARRRHHRPIPAQRRQHVHDDAAGGRGSGIRKKRLSHKWTRMNANEEEWDREENKKMGVGAKKSTEQSFSYLRLSAFICG